MSTSVRCCPGPAGAYPNDGIYMFEMDLAMTNDSNIATSLPFVVLYNHLANRFDLDEPNDDPQVQAVIGYARTLVPEPSGCVLATIGIATACGAAVRWRCTARIAADRRKPRNHMRYLLRLFEHWTPRYFKFAVARRRRFSTFHHA